MFVDNEFRFHCVQCSVIFVMKTCSSMAYPPCCILTPICTSGSHSDLTKNLVRLYKQPGVCVMHKQTIKKDVAKNGAITYFKERHVLGQYQLLRIESLTNFSGLALQNLLFHSFEFSCHWQEKGHSLQSFRDPGL